MTKIYGSNDPATDQIGQISQGIGEPFLPIDNFTGGGGGSVDSVNGQTGVVVLDADDIDDAATAHKFVTAAQIASIATSIQPGDNVSELTNDAGYLTSAPVESVNTQTGAVVLDADDIDDAATTNKFVSSAQIALINNSIQPADNVSELTNDAGYITAASVPVDSVNGQTGAVVLDADDIDDAATTNRFVTFAQLGLIDSAVQPGDNVSELTNDAGYLAAEVNDLTAAVVWANVPDANVTQSSVVQHEGALTITESQISDLKNYVEFGEYGIGEGLKGEENIDYDTRVVPGNYLISSAGAVNPPTTGAHLLQVVTGSTALGLNDRVVQVAYGYTATELQIHTRKLNGGTWSAWRETYTTGNLSPVTVDTAQTITGKKSFSSPVNLPTYTNGALPVGATQDLIYISDGNEGLPALGLYDGAEWTYTPVGMIPYLQGPLDLDTFLTPGKRFSIPVGTANIANHPYNSVRPISKGQTGEYIIIDVEQAKDVFYSKGAESFITQTARFPGCFSSAVLVRRYSSLQGWTVWSAKSASFEYQSDDSFDYAITSASTLANLSVWMQGESVWLTGSVAFSSALNGSEDYNSGAVILSPNSGATFALAPASIVAVPLIPTFAASNSNPRLILNTDGTISVITDSAASTGEYFFSTRYLRI